jgi:hypothetical protein
VLQESSNQSSVVLNVDDRNNRLSRYVSHSWACFGRDTSVPLVSGRAMFKREVL